MTSGHVADSGLWGPRRGHPGLRAVWPTRGFPKAEEGNGFTGLILRHPLLLPTPSLLGPCSRPLAHAHVSALE